MGLSLAQQIARLPKELQEAALEGIDMETLFWDWNFWSRPEQVPPRDDSWDMYVFLAGRGTGKTRSAAEWVREEARYTKYGKLRFSLVARTAADTRDIMVEGESGIIAVSPPSERPLYEPSKRRLTWPNGNVGTVFTADEPDSLRGVQSHRAWADEAAAYRQLVDEMSADAFTNLRISNRLGRNPKLMVTTTPKKTKLMRSILNEAETNPRVIIARGKTQDNVGNLSQTYIDGIEGIYAGTRLYRQEMLGEMLDDVEGALWTEKLIDDTRYEILRLGVPMKVIGVDPSVAENPRDECGIVVVGSSADRDLYRREAVVLDDMSLRAAPDKWAQRVVEAAHKWNAPVVAEINQGGAMVRSMINGIDPEIRVFEVHSMVGKALRAEPIVLAYEQKRVHHLGTFAELETQMTTWVPGETKKSPDRVDALVHGLTALLVKPPPGLAGGRLEAWSPGRKRIPMGRRSRVTMAATSGSRWGGSRA